MTRLAARGLGFAVRGASLLRGVSLTVQPGEFVAIIGPNGAGKSTLLRLLAGDLRPSAGSVELDGRELSAYSPPELARRRAVLPQQTRLQFGFRAREVVMMGRSALRESPGRLDDEAAAARWLARLEVGHLAERPFPSLSGGEQARVSLARVLAQETPIVLLDEPTAALDLRHQHALMGMARDLTCEGRTVAAVIHDLNLAAAYATRIVILDEGELVADGPSSDVLDPALLSRIYRLPLHILEQSRAPQIVPAFR